MDAVEKGLENLAAHQADIHLRACVSQSSLTKTFRTLRATVTCPKETRSSGKKKKKKDNTDEA